MADMLAFLFCAAIGFAIAGAVTSLYQLVTAEPADFTAPRAGLFGTLIAVLLTMFGGPLIVTRKILAGLRAGRLTFVPAACGVAVVGMWSVCAGLFFLSLLVAA
ncbi:MAG TPA: hypothetical protein VHG92_14630 [Afifellaceae bacterium]|nr:hypothetical protein [Afifellaceae bacterium]